VSAAVFTFLPEFLGARETWRYAIFAIAILAVVMWRPEGLITSSLLRWRPRASPLVSPVEQS
jgi:branched-chain amino acid transport system permease protein